MFTMNNCDILYDEYINANKKASNFYSLYLDRNHDEDLIKGNEMFNRGSLFLTDCIKCFLSIQNIEENFSEFYSTELNKIINGAYDKKDVSFLIQIAWERKDITSIQKNIHHLASFLLDNEKIDSASEYQLEQIIDLLNYKTDDLIPTNILKGICLANLTDIHQYGAFIKAICYLRRHDEKKVLEILDELRQTDRYKNDEYYREWVD